MPTAFRLPPFNSLRIFEAAGRCRGLQGWGRLLAAAVVAMGLGAVLAALLPTVLAAYKLSYLDQVLWRFTCF